MSVLGRITDYLGSGLQRSLSQLLLRSFSDGTVLALRAWRPDFYLCTHVKELCMAAHAHNRTAEEAEAGRSLGSQGR